MREGDKEGGERDRKQTQHTGNNWMSKAHLVKAAWDGNWVNESVYAPQRLPPPDKRGDPAGLHVSL